MRRCVARYKGSEGYWGYLISNSDTVVDGSRKPVVHLSLDEDVRSYMKDGYNIEGLYLRGNSIMANENIVTTVKMERWKLEEDKDIIVVAVTTEGNYKLVLVTVNLRTCKIDRIDIAHDIDLLLTVLKHHHVLLSNDLTSQINLWLYKEPYDRWITYYLTRNNTRVEQTILLSHLGIKTFKAPSRSCWKELKTIWHSDLGANSHGNETCQGFFYVLPGYSYVPCVRNYRGYNAKRYSVMTIFSSSYVQILTANGKIVEWHDDKNEGGFYDPLDFVVAKLKLRKIDEDEIIYKVNLARKSWNRKSEACVMSYTQGEEIFDCILVF